MAQVGPMAPVPMTQAAPMAMAMAMAVRMAQVAPQQRPALPRADRSPVGLPCDHFFGLGRIESAVPWMNALSLSMSAGFRRLVKSGMPSF